MYVYLHTMFSEETYAADDVDDQHYNEDDTHYSSYYAYEHFVANSTIIITVTCRCKLGYN